MISKLHFRKLYSLINKNFYCVAQELNKTAFLCQLKSRKILQISGPDAFKILQGITTNDISKFNSDPNLMSQYTCFLSPQGRILYDALLIRPYFQKSDHIQAIRNEVWVDVQKDCMDGLRKHIRKYCLRKKVEIDDLSDQIKVYALISPYMQSNEQQLGFSFQQTANQQIKGFAAEQESDEMYSNLAYVDPRSISLGIRLICTDIKSNDIQQIDEDYYKQFKILNGILEGNDLEQKLPFSVNMDFLNAVSFKKGCYVGQELTARSYHTGIIRKRAVPFLITKEPWDQYNKIINIDNRHLDQYFKDKLLGKSLLNKKGQEIGKVIAQYKNFGLVMANYLDRDNNSEDNLIKYEQNYQGQLLYNQWFENKIENYISELKSKQKSANFAG